MPLRIRAALLAILFLAGSFGVPVADALLFHQAGNDPFAGVVHIEGVDTAHHAERCLLSHATPAPRESLSVPTAPEAAQTLVIAGSFPQRTADPLTHRPADPPSRAPPA
jgi:hypothetical protein